MRTGSEREKLDEHGMHSRLARESTDKFSIREILAQQEEYMLTVVSQNY